jgi:hypothetical protein
MEKKDNVRLLACHFKRNVEMSVRMGNVLFIFIDDW